jgi:hypothetical protein
MNAYLPQVFDEFSRRLRKRHSLTARYVRNAGGFDAFVLLDAGRISLVRRRECILTLRLFLALHFLYYNLSAFVKRCTIPAMAAGVTKRFWEMSDVVEVLEACGRMQTHDNCIWVREQLAEVRR